MALKMLNPKMRKEVEELILSQSALASSPGPNMSPSIGQQQDTELDKNAHFYTNIKESNLTEKSKINDINESKPISNSGIFYK